MRAITAVLLGLGLLAGCGFQLRGEAELPSAMARTAIVSPRPGDELPRQLRLLLEGSGVSVVTDRDAAGAVLTLVEDRLTRVVQSIGASARVREFALEYRVRFRLDDSEGNALLPEQLLERRADFEFDQEQVVGISSEEELLRQEMARSMARDILRRLETAGGP